jgi:hypothetical protein
VCADAAHAERLVRALVANRRLAKPAIPVRLRAALAERLRLPAFEDRDPELAVAELGGDLSPLLRCRAVVLLAIGGAGEPLQAALADPMWPLHAHPRLTIVCDPPAAAHLPRPERRAGDHVAIVLGHREPGISAEHRISHESLERLQRAERLVARRPTRAVVLTGYTSTGGLSEAEQMAQGWRDPDVPFLLEVAGRDTAENATRSLPLVLALGGVRRVSVVTSAWHVRTPFFFAPYRRRGLEVGWVREWRGGDFSRMLADEFHKARWAPRERRDAWRSMGQIEP